MVDYYWLLEDCYIMKDNLFNIIFLVFMNTMNVYRNYSLGP